MPISTLRALQHHPLPLQNNSSSTSNTTSYSCNGNPLKTGRALQKEDSDRNTDKFNDTNTNCDNNKSKQPDNSSSINSRNENTQIANSIHEYIDKEHTLKNDTGDLGTRHRTELKLSEEYTSCKGPPEDRTNNNNKTINIAESDTNNINTMKISNISEVVTSKTTNIPPSQTSTISNIHKTLDSQSPSNKKNIISANPNKSEPVPPTTPNSSETLASTIPRICVSNDKVPVQKMPLKIVSATLKFVDKPGVTSDVISNDIQTKKKSTTAITLNNKNNTNNNTNNALNSNHPTTPNKPPLSPTCIATRQSSMAQANNSDHSKESPTFSYGNSSIGAKNSTGNQLPSEQGYQAATSVGTKYTVAFETSNTSVDTEANIVGETSKIPDEISNSQDSMQSSVCVSDTTMETNTDSSSQISFGSSGSTSPSLSPSSPSLSFRGSTTGSLSDSSATPTHSPRLSPTPCTLTCNVHYLNDIDPFAFASTFLQPPLAMRFTFATDRPLSDHLPGLHRMLDAPQNLDDASLQVYREGDYCTYLDLDTPLAQQAEDIDNITDSKKNAIILRTQLSVRVHAIIEKLNTSEGRELRRALFSLKQIFQDDKDLVHAFVQNDGLTCLVKVGASADQNYQNYILRALGQVMLYVDGMNGVAEHPETVQWLYSLIGSKYRLVVKTALKLLLVFVEYTESNSLVLVRAIENVDLSKGQQPWSTIMRLLEGTDGLDMELQTFAMTLINKALNGIPDQDNYYDQTDWLEELGMELLVQKFLHNPNSDLDLLQQLTIYEAVLSYEDGDDECRTRTIDPTIRQVPRSSVMDRDSLDRRKSRRHAGSPVPVKKITLKTPTHLKVPAREDRGKSSSDDEHPHHFTPIGKGLPIDDLGGIKHADDGLTPALRRRRERAERQRTFLNDQESRRGSHSSDNNSSVEDENSKNCEVHCLNQQATWMFEMLYGKSRKDEDAQSNARRESLTNIEGIASRISSLHDKENVDTANKRAPIEIKSAASVRELTEKMQKGITLTVAEQEKLARLGDITGRIAKAKDDLDKVQQTKTDSKEPPVPEPPKKSENDIQWDNLIKHLNRSLELCDLDFTDLTEADDVDVMAVTTTGRPPPPPPPPPPFMNGIPPPPPPQGIPPPPCIPPPAAGTGPTSNGSPHPGQEPSKDGFIPPPPPAPPTEGFIPPPPPLGSYGQHLAPKPGHGFGIGLVPILQPKKTKKTIKLFWNEVQKDPNRQVGVPTVWEEVKEVELDNARLEHLFESRAKDINAKERQQEQKGVKELVVLDPKRSNVINIGMTKLPPPRTIKTAILKMDSSIINREGIEKLLSTMLPSTEEKQKIQEAAIANPEVPLGSAEQFLMMLSTISELPARLKLWLFKLDYDLMEKEVAEPLMDLKQGISDLRKNSTFKILLSVLLSVGNFLNGTDCRGFQIEYLSKVPEVKDTVHKHSLLHHLCHMVIEKFPDTTDLYSEVGAITRASKVDFDELANNIEKMKVECKASWDYLKVIAKHDGPTQMKLKMSEFLADCAERIIVLGIIYRRVLHRFQRFLTYLGSPAHKAKEAKAKDVCGVISEFALEYRTCRERVQQQLQKKANHRERNKTRGKMIMEMEKFKPKPKTKEEKADCDLRHLLSVADVGDTDTIRGKHTWRRTKEGAGAPKHRSSRGDDALTEMLLMGDGDDALLDSLVRTATQAPQSRTTPRERKRSRHADRKSFPSSNPRRSRSRRSVLEGPELQTVTLPH